ncbi:MAG: hypothetical protein ABGW69_01840 [Nanoarchaeota archaeon]
MTKESIEKIEEKKKEIIEKEIEGKCLNCGHNKLIYREVDYEIPNAGKYKLISFECKKCGFVFKDFYPIEQKEGKKIKLKIKDKKALNTLISRSSDAWIYLKNIDLVVKPIEGEPMLTTIEGLLQKMEKAVKLMNNKNINEKFEKLKNLEEEIEIEIEDKSGLSNVVEKKGNIEIKEEKLTQTEDKK